jgi:outer membrane protein W
MKETLSRVGPRAPRRYSWAWVVAICLLAGPTLATAADSAQCVADNKNRIARKLGTRNSFVRGGVKTAAALEQMFRDQAPEIACVLESRGLGRLQDELAAAASTATVRPLGNGECFAWLTHRKGRKVVSAPLCMKTTKTYDTWDIRFDELVSEKIEPPICKISASGDAANQTLNVSTAGSSPGAKVSWTSSDGRSGDLAGASMPWTNLCTADYSFTVAAQTEGTRILANHLFTVPQVCGNLSYISATERTERFTRDCRETATVARHVPPPPPVTITATPDVVKTKQAVNVAATADSVCLQSLTVVTTDPRGNEIDRRDSAASPIAYETSFKKPGVHTLVATGVDAINQTGTATATVRVRPRWSLRFFGAHITPDDDAIMTDRLRNARTIERTAFNLDSGFGVGASAEYHATERVGIEGGLLYGRLDSLFKLDINGQWEMEDGDVDMTLFSVGPNFHFTRADSPVDVYLGAFVALASLGEGEYTPLGENHERDLDNDVAFGAQLGFGFRWDPQWAVHAGVRYVDLSTDVDLEASGSNRDISIDPLIITAGITYSF